MKKVLLSLSMLAAMMTANAQNFEIYDAADKSSFTGAGTPFIFDPGVNGFTVDTATTAPYIITASGTAPAGKYYINGFGNGSYASNGDKQPFGYTATNFATDKFFMNVQSSVADEMKVKVQFSTFTNGMEDADIYGYEFDLAGGANFVDVSVLMSSFSKIVNDNPDGVTKLTQALAAKIGKIEFAIIKRANGGTGLGTVKFKNMTIGQSSTITSVYNSANIGSTVVFPNPAENSFTAQVNLKSSANVSITVSDMMGNVVKTEELGNVVSASKEINVAGLAKGMYTVTYILDGAPAKAEKIMVK